MKNNAKTYLKISPIPGELAEHVLNILKLETENNFDTEIICRIFNINQIIHEEKKVLYNKLIFSQYNPQERTIHIYKNSLKERFENNYVSAISKAFYHELFHFLLNNHVKRFIYKAFDNNDIENAADLFAEKLLNEVKK